MLSSVMWNVIMLGVVIILSVVAPLVPGFQKFPISLTGMTHSTACRAVNEPWPSRKRRSSSTSGPSTPKSGPGRIGVHPAGWTRQSTTSFGQPELSRCQCYKKNSALTLDIREYIDSGNTKGGSITVPMTSISIQLKLFSA
jgi:hypothetical protein